MSASPETRPDTIAFEGATPILRVADMAASVDYYVQALGFTCNWKYPDTGFASVSRGKCHIFLCQSDQGHPGCWIWIGVEDAGALHAEYQRSGAKIRHLPNNYHWAYEMQARRKRPSDGLGIQGTRALWRAARCERPRLVPGGC